MFMEAEIKMETKPETPRETAIRILTWHYVANGITHELTQLEDYNLRRFVESLK